MRANQGGGSRVVQSHNVPNGHVVQSQPVPNGSVVRSNRNVAVNGMGNSVAPPRRDSAARARDM